MATNVKMPPRLEAEDTYLEWTNDLKIWQLFTDLEIERQGPAVYLSLTGRARECVRDLTPEQISSKEGVQHITNKLDAVFKKDQNTRAYIAFKEFYDYKRTSGMTIADFIVRFEYLYHKLQQFDMKLPEGVKAFFLLNAANVSEDNEKLARATVGELNYDNMKQKIQKIFGDPNSNDTDVSCKVEPVMYSTKRGGMWRGRANRGNFYYNNRGRGDRGGYGGYSERGAVGGLRQQRYEYNPTGSDNKPLKCYNCESVKHMSRDCPHKYDSNNRKDKDNVKLTLFGSGENENMLKTVHESFGMAILDSGCTKTVTGRVWLEAYIESLNTADKKTVIYEKDSSKFRFGDGKEVISKVNVQIPAYVANQRVTIKTSLVDNEIPLLLSRSAMKKAEMTVDFENDMATIYGTEVKLITSSSGHYCLPITKYLLKEETESEIVLHATSVKGNDYKEKKAKAKKLHRQLAHASKEKLIRLVKETKDFNDDEFIRGIRETCDECDICEPFKKEPLKPAVGFRLASDFNQVVCMDLKQVEFVHNTWILHLIDATTRYSAACLIKTKMQEEIVKHIFRIWITYFGAPRKMLSDNGGEFDNETFREMNEKLNVQTCNTAAESPWSNGMVERHNAILYESMMKTMKDAQCDPEIALAWAVSAKNSLQNSGGYSPNQLVFGRNINLPNVLQDEPPAHNIDTNSELIRINLEAMHKARENFIKAESSERIRRALRAKVRTYADEKFEQGQLVYYKRKNTKGWKGPGVVIGIDAKMVMIKHGGSMYKVHPCQVIKKKSYDDTDRNQNEEDKEHEKPKKVETKDQVDKNEKDVVTEEESELNFKENNIEMEDIEQEDAITDQRDEQNIVNDDREERDENKPKRNSFVKFKLNGEWQKGKILSYQPKQSGKYRNWINLKASEDTEPKCVNWDDVETWTHIDNEEEIFLTTTQIKSQEVVDAKAREMKNMIDNDVFEEVEKEQQTPVITARWVITEKTKGDTTYTKARLVARGFEEDSQQFKKDSPTCTRESLRLLFTTAAIKTWELHSLDVTAAFLQGNEIQRDVFLQPPRDVCEKGKLWRLKRCIYGLTDAPRAWYEKVKTTLCSLGAKVSLYDNSFFLFHKQDGTLMGLVAVHVDDFVYCGSEELHSRVIETIKKKFSIKQIEKNSFKYVGLQVSQTEHEIRLNQDSYIKSIEEIQRDNQGDRKNKEELNQEERKKLKALGGQMLWVASQTRPDLSYETCVVTNVTQSSTVKTIHDANKAIIKMKAQTVDIRFPSLSEVSDIKIKAYTDATYASLDDGSSQGGHIVFLEGANKKAIPITWQSKKLNRVTKSPLASEALSLAEGADAGFLVAKMFQEIFKTQEAIKIECITDNESLCQTLKTTTTIADKRMRVDIARLRQMVDREEIQVSWVEGSRQLADCLTKRGASSKKLLEVLQNCKLA